VQSGRIVEFIFIDITSITASEAIVQIGTDIALPRQPMIKLCCCSGVARYAKQNARWVFARSGPIACA